MEREPALARAFVRTGAEPPGLGARKRARLAGAVGVHERERRDSLGHEVAARATRVPVRVRLGDGEEPQGSDEGAPGRVLRGPLANPIRRMPASVMVVCCSAWPHDTPSASGPNGMELWLISLGRAGLPCSGLIDHFAADAPR